MPKRTWPRMFSDAFRGLRVGLFGERTFAAHFAIAVCVVVAAIVFRVTPLEWLVLLSCITLVFTAELLNTGLEHLARAVTTEENPHVRNALDVAAGAVLAAGIGSAICGTIIFLPYLLAWYQATSP